MEDRDAKGRRRSGSNDSGSSGSSYDPATALLDEIAESQSQTVAKRKPPPLGPSNESRSKRQKVPAYTPEEPGSHVKKVSQDRSRQLPAELWHFIFTFVPPRALGNLLAVNRLFHNFLHHAPISRTPYPQFLAPITSVYGASARSQPLPLLAPDSIWQASRRLFCPRMPAPLKGMKELDMWRLIGSRSCQFCGRLDGREGQVAKDPWHRGPGPKGVSPIFAFCIVSCGPCLMERGLKEADLVLSSTTPSILLPGLPVVFLTPDLHVVSPQTIQNDREPTRRELTKLYWKKQVEDIKAGFEDALRLGPEAAEEWLKGVEGLGRSARSDVSRWERWEASGGLRQVLSHPSHSQPKASSLAPSKSQPNPTNRLAARPGTDTRRNETAQKMPDLGNKQLNTSMTGVAPRPHTQSAPVRTAEESAEVKYGGQEAVDENVENATRLAAHTPGALTNGTSGTTRTRRQPQDISDEEWDEAQGPVRARMSELADEIIRDKWKQGKNLGKKSCPQFASDVLLYVRRRFYDDVAKEAAVSASDGKKPAADPPEGPWTRKLTLENMKWVFNVKIRPHTQKHRSELFLCNRCPVGAKYYGLESVLQHYAAKHTQALSKGNVVVHWRAEWPETPPFRPNPKPSTSQQAAEPQDHQGHQVLPPEARSSSTYAGYHVSSAAIPAPNVAGSNPPLQFAPMPPYAPEPAPYVGSAFTQSPQGPHPAYSWENSYSSTAQTSTDGTNHAQPFSHRRRPQLHSSLRGQGAEPHAPGSAYNARLEFMGGVARYAWSRISHVDGLDGAIKLCVIIHHIAKGFEMHFSEPALLLMFIHGLSSHPDMQPVCSISGLKCKPCMDEMFSNSQASSFSVPQLAEHFRKVHVESSTPPLDWRTQMVTLPEFHVLARISALLARDREAYETVADALPWAFGDNSGAPMRPANDYELLEVHDPEKGTYYISRPIRQDAYVHGVRGEVAMRPRPLRFADTREEGIMGPSWADNDQYDPRYPAG